MQKSAAGRFHDGPLKIVSDKPLTAPPKRRAHQGYVNSEDRKMIVGLLNAKCLPTALSPPVRANGILGTSRFQSSSGQNTPLPVVWEGRQKLRDSRVVNSL